MSYYDQDAVLYWSRHYENYLVLDRLLTSSLSSAERADIRRQLRVCQQRMDHWQRHPNWSAESAARAAAAAKAAAGRVTTG